MSVIFILGGARSGKSTYAEAQALNDYQTTPDSHLHYIASAVAFDQEMQHRIAHHQQRRSGLWQLHEAPYHLSQTLRQFTETDVVLVDCLTVWLNNLIFQLGDNVSDEQLIAEVSQLASILEASPARIYLVSNEVGMGVIPMGAVTRLFVDHAGWMNQAIAKIAQQVILVTAGLPLKLK